MGRRRRRVGGRGGVGVMESNTAGREDQRIGRRGRDREAQRSTEETERQ